MRYAGACHCQAVQFEVDLPDSIECERCNCSICELIGYIHCIVPKRDFYLLKGKEHITTYEFNTGAAKHTFCKVCGVKSFYTPRSNPDGISVNLRALKSKPPKVNISDFDGQNWEQNAASLAHKSK